MVEAQARLAVLLMEPQLTKETHDSLLFQEADGTEGALSGTSVPGFLNPCALWVRKKALFALKDTYQ